MPDVVLSWKLARRELRSGFSGFRIFFLCLVLGVASLAGIESLSAAFLTGLAEQGRTLLGGDVAVGLVHRSATAAEHDFLARYGRVSESVSMRAMAYAMRRGDARERQLIELRAVDGSFPLFGAVSTAPAGSLARDLSCDAKLCGAVVEQTALDRLHVALG